MDRSLIRALLGLTVAVILLGVIAPARAGDPLTLVNGKDAYDLVGVIEMLEDPDNAWTIETVTSPAFAGRFKRLEGQPGFLGDTRSAFWFRFSVDNSARGGQGGPWVLSGFTRALESFQLYHEDAGNWEVNTGGYSEIGEIAIPIVVPLPLSGKREQQFYLRVQSETAVFVQLSIETARARARSSGWQMFWYGGFCGLLGMIILLNGLMFVYLKDRSYLFCLLYQLSMAIYALGQNGFFDVYLPKPQFESWTYFHVVLIGLVVISSGAFTRSFLGTRIYAPRSDKLILAYMIGAAAMLLVTPVAHPRVLMWWTIVLGLMTPLVTILPGIVRLIQGFGPARLHLAAWGIFSACTFLYAMPIEMGWWEGYLFQGGCAVNSVLLTLALVDRMRIMRNEREAATEALVESERRFRTLANATSANIVIVQGERFVYANQGFVDFAGMAWEQLKGTPVSQVLGKEAIERAITAIDSAQQGGDTKYRFEIADPRGERWYEVSAGIFEMDGEQAVISTSFDITARKRADEQMYRAEKMAALGQIIAGVAHEINNPNNFIYFNLPILRKYIEAIRPMLDEHAARDTQLKILNMPYDVFLEDVFKLLENMEHGSKRITGIVAELKDHVRAEDGLDARPEQLGSVVDHVMTLIGKQVRKMVRQFDVDLAEGLLPVKMNAGKIEQVLINFVINAGQAADKDESFVRLSVRECPECPEDIEILIEDNGKGIPEENLHQIFEPFYTTKGREQGTGLGLSISQRIIEEHGGSISVESTLGEGTCFSIRLPTVSG